MKQGDKVRIRMATLNCFPWMKKGRLWFTATYESGPQGAGDTFTLTCQGIPLELNGNSPEFVGMWVIEDQE